MSYALGPYSIAGGVEFTLTPPPGVVVAAVGLTNVSGLPLLLKGGEEWLGPWQATVVALESTLQPIVVDPQGSGTGQLLATWFTPEEAARATGTSAPSGSIPFPPSPSGGVGSIQMTASATLPASWLWCDGTAYDPNLQPELFAAIGTTYGGNGVTTFLVPDLRGTAPIGAGLQPGLTNRPLGSSVGAETVVLTTPTIPAHSHGVTDPTHAHGGSQPAHSHAGSQAAHNHGVTDGGHVHGLNVASSTMAIKFGGSTEGISTTYDASGITFSIPYTDIGTTGVTIDNATPAVTIGNATPAVTVGAAATGVSTNNAGGGGAHANMQPSLAVNFMILASSS